MLSSPTVTHSPDFTLLGFLEANFCEIWNLNCMNIKDGVENLQILNTAVSHGDVGILRYWNSRLGTERQRLLSGFNRNDVICDVFSGVDPIAISAAKIVKRVYANDLNPFAVEYLERNCVLNKLERRVKV
ncbi:tRNA transferase Trm5/Tyw2 [Corchorus olitorius]|uniref:tRNA transferase Trm5/Tyw2 n=1 Tax=Corchorus olitorius TaxID=93759 RepID=A0A1R3GXE5_9ROSI|nr:tRNA transferase Trm5/Tyw2 [Corchorus olitorius]